MIDWLFKLIVASLVLASGCKTPKPRHLKDLAGDIGRFEQSEYSTPSVTERGGELVTVRFDGVPFGRACAMLSDRTGRTIVWAETLDEKQAVGYFVEQPLGLVLDGLGRRVGAEVNDLGGVLFIGEVGPNDLAAAVVPLPPGDQEQMSQAFRELLSGRGRLSVVNGSMFVRDSADAVAKLVREVETHRQAALRRYVCEVYLMRVRQSDLLNVGADLEVQGVDLLDGPNAKELFNLVARAEGGIDGAEVWRRPLLHLSEGLPGVLFVGRTTTVAQKATNESGVIETTGYQQFQDGLRVEVTCRRVSHGMVSCDVVMRFSEFLASDKDVPDQDEEEVTTNVVASHGEVVLVSALGRESKRQLWRLFGVQKESEADNLLVWMRVRELSPGGQGSVPFSGDGVFGEIQDTPEQPPAETQGQADASDPSETPPGP